MRVGFRAALAAVSGVAIFACTATSPAAAEGAPRQNEITLGLGPVSEGDLLKNALALLIAGKVEKARQLYLYLAARELPEGASGVGDTYNSLLLSAIPSENTFGNDAQAVFWYRRAKELETFTKQASAQEMPSAVPGRK